MKQVHLGSTTIPVSAIALGIMRMHTLSVDEAAQLIDTAYEEGITFIDSADIYGKGKSEEVFGEALQKSHVKREQLFIQSKVGIVKDPHHFDFTKEHIVQAVDGILNRMHTTYLDSLVLHRPDPLVDYEEVKEAFDQLQASGKVRFFGVSNCNPMQIEVLQSHLTQRLLVDQLQFGLMHTNMIDFGLHTNMSDADSINHDGELIEYCRKNGVTIQAWSPFQYGFIEGSFIDNPKFPELNEELDKLSKRYGVGKNAIAASWILKHPANMQVIIGTMNVDHLKDSAQAGSVELTRQEWFDLYVASGHLLP